MKEAMNHIPKKIHYIWFGGAPLTDEAERCIASWRSFMPEYEIVRWDESNFNTHSCPYIEEACEAGKWAFASDYARFAILHSQGGVYLDTDVELIRSLEDIVQQGPYMGMETDFGSSAGITVNPGLGLAAFPGMPLFKKVLDSYAKDHFVKHGIYDQTTVVARVTEILKAEGLADIPGIQQIGEVTLYPSEYFCPIKFLSNKLNITENTHSIHHFDSSWAGPLTRFKHLIMKLVGAKGVALYKAIKHCLKQ